MPTKAQFRMTLMTVVGFSMAACLVRLWAARHSTHSGLDGLVADAANATF